MGYQLVMIRHGESVWNQKNLFTGWTDVDLSETGHKEAAQGGVLLKEAGFSFDVCYTSYLQRAIHTANHVLQELNEEWIPVIKTWKLNERHYGALQGLNKSETAEKYGEAQVKVWRRSFDVQPPALEPTDERNPALQAPYKNVIVLGHVQDENGQKMSKSKGNAVDPFDALNKYGADAIRWYFYINSAPWLPNRFHGKAVVEGQRKFMSTLWNTYAFFVLYADIDNFDPTKYELNYDQLPVMDKWLLSRLNTTVQAVDNDLANYKIPEAARALQEFVDEMSNWYVRRSRERFWAKGMEQDKINAYMTLYHALVTIAKTAAPMIPFMTEDMYQNLVRSVDKDAPESIHLCDFPTVNEAWIDKDLEADMKELLEIVVLGRACRNTANIKNRQPIGTMYVKAEKKMSEFYTDIIADELNVKEVKFADDVESFISYSFKPQLRTVGPKYGKLLGGIRQALTDINGTAAMNELRTNGVLKLDINGNDVELTEEDLLIETAQTEGYVSESDGETSVVLDTNLTPELIEEGFVREIISKIQTMRKEAGFEVMDKIVVYAHGNDKIQNVMKAHEDEIKSEVLADEMVLGETDGYVKEWNINKEAVTMGVKKL